MEEIFTARNIQNGGKRGIAIWLHINIVYKIWYWYTQAQWGNNNMREKVVKKHSELLGEYSDYEEPYRTYVDGPLAFRKPKSPESKIDQLNKKTSALRKRLAKGGPNELLITQL
ncbi:hypothetical protein C2G38_2193817 [Gigaspora rosea]|uniref:Uncharacterized protein n=1 Tax=Gigaspora rosea TaxID=44941 RepID=A0A397UYR8_9GLOM|nr:hypothetical protein C2G38_2193817 [Gigaspora rosea]